MTKHLSAIIFIGISFLHFPELSAQEENRILRINRIVEDINQDTTFHVISFPYYELYISTEGYGSQIKGYFKKESYSYHRRSV
jgi:hypothetical protein